MTIEEQIKKLRGNRLFEKIYNKYKQRRHRNKNITLQRVRELTLSEYYLLIQQYKTDSNVKPPEDNEKPDFYVMVGGKSMLNSEWKKLMRTQREIGNTKITPSPNWELRHIHYLKSLFAKDHQKKEQRTVDLWDN